jgi:putative flippase GtrA
VNGRLGQALQAHKGVLVKFLTFAAMGLVGTAAHFGVLFAMVYLGFDPVASSVAGSIAGMVVNFTLNHHVTFKGSADVMHSAPRYFIVSITVIVLNGVFMSVLVHGLGVHFVIAQVLTSGTLLVFGFACNALWSFRS